MNRNLLIALTALLILSTPGLFAQTKFIAYRSHSGIDRLFDPDGAGNFGEINERDEWVQKDTIARRDTSAGGTREGKIKMKPKPIEESLKVKQGEQKEPMKVMEEPKVAPEPQAPESTTPESAFPENRPTTKPEEPGISQTTNSDSLPSAVAQTSAIYTSGDSSGESKGNGSGSLIWLAIGLGLPAATIAVLGVARWNRDIG